MNLALQGLLHRRAFGGATPQPTAAELIVEAQSKALANLTQAVDKDQPNLLAHRYLEKWRLVMCWMQQEMRKLRKYIHHLDCKNTSIIQLADFNQAEQSKNQWLNSRISCKSTKPS